MIFGLRPAWLLGVGMIAIMPVPALAAGAQKGEMGFVAAVEPDIPGELDIPGKTPEPLWLALLATARSCNPLHS